MDTLEHDRPLLVSLAYRMTGRASEAEDLAQEAYVRFLTDEPDDGRPAREQLTTIVARLCLDYLSSEPVENAHYEGPWLPEPVLTERDALPPLQTAAQRESISLAFLTLLDGLEPPERAVYLLRDAFGYGGDEIAAMLDVAEADYRQTYDRAAARIAAARPNFTYAPEAQRRVIERLVLAAHQDDPDDVQEILAPEVTAWIDGGGQVAAALRPVTGRDAVARYLSGFMRRASATLAMTYAEVNSAPGLLSTREESVESVIAFDVAGGAIQGVRFMLNPDKLAFIERQLRERD